MTSPTIEYGRLWCNVGEGEGGVLRLRVFVVNLVWVHVTSVDVNQIVLAVIIVVCRLVGGAKWPVVMRNVVYPGRIGLCRVKLAGETQRFGETRPSLAGIGTGIVFLVRRAVADIRRVDWNAVGHRIKRRVFVWAAV